MPAIGFLPTVSLLAAASAFACAAVSDFRTHLIPNRYAASAIAAFVVMASRLPATFFWGGLLTGGAVFAACAFLFARGWIGGGDVKLFTAAALWAGPSNVAALAETTSIAGLLLGAAMMSPLSRFAPRPASTVSGSGESSLAPGRQPMAYGVAIAAGALFVLARLA